MIFFLLCVYPCVCVRSSFERWPMALPRTRTSVSFTITLAFLLAVAKLPTSSRIGPADCVESRTDPSTAFAVGKHARACQQNRTWTARPTPKSSGGPKTLWYLVPLHTFPLEVAAANQPARKTLETTTLPKLKAAEARAKKAELRAPTHAERMTVLSANRLTPDDLQELDEMIQQSGHTPNIQP